MKVGELFAEIGLDKTNFDKGLGAAQKAMSAAAKTIAASAAAAGAALGAAAATGVKSLAEFEQAVDRLQATTNVTATEAEKMGDVARDVWGGAWGDSLTGVTEDVALLRRILGDMSDETTKSITEAALTIEDLFQAPVEETSNVVRNLVSNFDGLSKSDAFDLITTGFQQGGDYAGDLLDTLKEYAPQFSAMGLSADEMLGILIAGADEGAWNLDKVGDAVKEFQIRAQDGSDTTAEGFAAIGLNAEEMGAKIAAGGDFANQAFQVTLAALASIEDPLARNQAGVALFGTMWEDLGPTVVTAMAEGANAISGFEGATKRAGETAYDNFATNLTSIRREFQSFFMEAAAPFMEFLNEMLNSVQENMPAIQEFIRGAFEQISGVITTSRDTFDSVQKVFQSFFTTMQPLWDAFGRSLSELKESLGPLWNSFEQLLSSLRPLAEILGGILAVNIGVMIGGLNGAIRAIGPLIEAVLNLADVVVNVFKSIISLLTGDFTGALDYWKQATDSSIKFFINLWEGVYNFFKGFIDGIVGFFQGLYDTLVGHSIIPDLVNAILMWIGNLVTAGSRLIQELVNSVISFFQRLLTSAVSIWTNLKTTIVNLATNLKTGTLSQLSEIWEHIKSIPQQAIQWGKDIMQALADGIASVRIPLPDIDFDWRDGPMGIRIPDLDIGVKWRQLGDLIPGLADGGNILRAGSVLVGERGPEVLSLPRGAQVQPLDRDATDGGTNINGPIILQIDPRSIRDVDDLINLFNKLSQAARARG